MALLNLGRNVYPSLIRIVARLARVDWRRETIYPLTVAMEVAWFAPWYMALIPATGRLPAGRTAMGLFSITVIPVYAARVLDRLHLKTKVRRAVLAMLLVVTCLLAMRVFLYAGQAYKGFDWLAETLKDVLNVYEIIPDWLVVVLSTIYLWWRGISLGRRRPAVDAVALSFFVGIVSFIAFALLVSLVTSQDPSFFIPIFFFCSLVALAATRMEEMRGLRGAIRSPFGFSWLISMTVAASVVVLAGALLGALLTGSEITSVIRWLQPLLLLVGLALAAVLVALRTVVNWFLRVLGALGLEDVSAPFAELLDGLSELVPDSPDASLETPAAVGAAAGAVRLVLLLGLTVGLGALVIWMVRQQGVSRYAREEEEEHELTLTSTVLLDNLRQLLDAGRGRLVSVLGLVGRSGLRGLFAALTIRRIYAQMLRLAAEQGYPRAASQTPYEYRKTALRAFPGSSEAVYTITEAYVAVHYGEVPETDAELQDIRACWESLKESLRTSAI